jgi:hypothetical protein
MVGVGAELYVESEDKNGFVREIRSQLQQDGQTINSISITDTIIIVASYEN